MSSRPVLAPPDCYLKGIINPVAYCTLELREGEYVVDIRRFPFRALSNPHVQSTLFACAVVFSVAAVVCAFLY